MSSLFYAIVNVFYMKKKSVYLCMCLFFLLQYSYPVYAQSETRPKYAPFSERHKNKTDELGQKQGTWKFFNRTSEIMFEFDFVNDKKHGPSKKYFTGAKIMEEVEYLNGKKDGNYRKYYFSGQVLLEGQYENGKRTGKWIYYFDDGTVKIEGSYKLGQMHGEWVTKDRKGNVRSQRNYADGIDVDVLKKQNELKAAQNAAKEAGAKPLKNEVGQKKSVK